MATKSIDYAANLADAEAKKAALELYINSLKAALAAGALGNPGQMPDGSESGTPPASMGEAFELPVGILSNKSVPAGILLHLSAVRKKQTMQQIADALKEGGVETRAKNFTKVITSTLARLKDTKKVLKLKDGSWGLAELYPEHIRKAMFDERKPTSKNAKAKKVTKGSTGKGKGSPKAEKRTDIPSVVVPITTKEGLFQQIENVLKSDTAKSFSAEEIAQTLGVGVQSIVMSLGRLALNHKAEKCSDGKFRVPTEHVQKAS